MEGNCTLFIGLNIVWVFPYNYYMCSSFHDFFCLGECLLFSCILPWITYSLTKWTNSLKLYMLMLIYSSWVPPVVSWLKLFLFKKQKFGVTIVTVNTSKILVNHSESSHKSTLALRRARLPSVQGRQHRGVVVGLDACHAAARFHKFHQ